MIEPLHTFVQSKLFQWLILGLIVVAAVLVGVETYPSMMAQYGPLLDVLNKIIIWAFVLEAVLKMAQYGKQFYRYFLDPWNVADFIITVVCLLPFDTSYAAVLRLARILRAMRLVTTVPRLQVLANSMLKSIPSMFYVGIMLTLTFYIYGVMGVHLFGANDPVHFRDLPNAMLTLFRVVTLEEWTSIMDIQRLGADVAELNNTTAITPVPLAQPIVGTFYFVSFVFLGTMVVLNLFIGIIVGSMSEAQEETQKQHLKEMAESGERPSLADDFMAIDERVADLAKQIQTLRLRLENRAEAADDKPTL
jgi:voltage-gated sodium channel